MNTYEIEIFWTIVGVSIVFRWRQILRMQIETTVLKLATGLLRPKVVLKWNKHLPLRLAWKAGGLRVFVGVATARFLDWSRA